MLTNFETKVFQVPEVFKYLFKDKLFLSWVLLHPFFSDFASLKLGKFWLRLGEYRRGCEGTPGERVKI